MNNYFCVQTLVRVLSGLLKAIFNLIKLYLPHVRKRTDAILLNAILPNSLKKARCPGYKPSGF